ncbi:phenazine biosynthesis protein PhzF family [Actinopolyspora xinjiangensis]|uniref:Phenazine biosynthesis protein PhzF family n=1 Tax=Actinopolyspora xinjiangensis TaxID=405564 RepID=A0A1H0P3U9_9ACTN|nr:PhzF family phenazine biosynthesis protein [Actinopolyspora xinjiangensis]SDO99631.1 phenazine biosynthesis protein PhzF family [Actinopolyspora xinjiangensis]
MRGYLVDSFTDTPMSGNPAGVVLLDEPADAAWMQAVAAEFNQSETAFVVAGGDENSAKPLRWFSPTTEVDLCGHATLATAHVLAGSQRFDTRGGELRCEVTADGTVEMDFPLRPNEPAEDVSVTAALGDVSPERVIAVARSGTDLLVQLDDAGLVRELRPDLSEVPRITERGMIVTAASDRPDRDFVSRFFAPAVGVPEDPVTGSAHCSLAPWWAERLGRAELVGEQVSSRGGTVRARLRGQRVGLGGRAVTVLEATLTA